MNEESFMDKQLSNLINAINYMDAFENETDNIINYKDEDGKVLGDMFCQGFAWPSMCYLVAEKRNLPPFVIEQYKCFYKLMMEASYKCYLLSGYFDNGDKLWEHSLKLNGMVSESIVHWNIDPIVVFDIVQKERSVINTNAKDTPKMKRKKFLGLF